MCANRTKSEPQGKCRLFHSWQDDRRVGWDGTPFSMEPVFGTRTCRRCGKHQKYHFDSQGGWWETMRS